jgi:hypothetical protein
MARQGFRRNGKAIAGILHNDPGGKAAVKAAAEQILARINADNVSASHSDEAFLTEYHTDRYVVGVVVRADDQAKHGTATRAANG